MTIQPHTIPLKLKPNRGEIVGAAPAFLDIPPFPGASVRQFSSIFEPRQDQPPSEMETLIGALRSARVGGTYWGEQPQLPDAFILSDRPDLTNHPLFDEDDVATVSWPPTVCDPWHMLAGSRGLVVERVDHRCAVAAALEVPVLIADGTGSQLRSGDREARIVLEFLLNSLLAANPFNSQPMDALETITLCGFWRSIIDSNRGIAGGLGFAFWKQRNVAPLLWDGTSDFRFLPSETDLHSRGAVAIWRSKVSRQSMAALETNKRQLIEVEDGFLRSSGLGADCVPPLSIVVDRLGAYFDPSRPSELEEILENGQFDADMIMRANALRSIIVEAGLGKYGLSDRILERPGGSLHHILVTGQVEDDRSVLEGGGGLVSNLDLLRRVREAEPDAFIIYKPHPDVVAGHRAGHIDEKSVLELANAIASDEAIAPLLAMVDAVHVNTSLTGFEALLREKPVTTYGVPFYAGWGLTEDRGRVPERRSMKRTLDELVAATLLVYPRYLDPQTGLPCPAEIVVKRLAGGNAPQTGLLVRLRRWQGAVARQFRKLVQ